MNGRLLTWVVMLALSVFGLNTVHADTVTGLDHVSVNGSLMKMANGTISLEARFASGTKILLIPLSTVESIEFNSIAFNPGAPPKPYGLGPGYSHSPHPEVPRQHIVNDAVELRGAKGERQPCKVVSIDQDVVHCDSSQSPTQIGPQNQFARRLVLRILVGGGG